MQDTNMGANPYAAPAARVEQPFHADTESAKSSRGARLGAYLLDMATGLIVVVPFMVGGARQVGTGTLGREAFGMAAVVGGVLFLVLLAYNLLLLHRNGQTVGKKLVGIRIVRTDGSRAGLGRIFALRYLVPGVIGAIPLVGFLFALADPLWIFGEERRCIHDYLADTIVVDA